MSHSAASPPPVNDGSEPILTGWRYRASLYTVAVAAIGYLTFSLWGGWRDVLQAAKNVGLIGLCVALSLSLVNYGLRFVRWQAYLLVMRHSVPWRPSLGIYLAGFALTTTPGKAGELLRGVLLRSRGVPFSVSVAAFLSERLSDLIAIVLLALVGLTAYPHARSIVAIGVVIVVLGLAILSNEELIRALSARFKNSSRVGGAIQHSLQILQQAKHCHVPWLLALATGLSVLAWASEAFAFYLILGWMNVDVSFAFAVFAYAASMLAGALSFMPGGLGGAEAVMMAILLWQGVSVADSVAATVLIRLATLWFAVAIGCVMLLKQPDSISPDARCG